MPNGIFNQQIETQPAAQQATSPVTANSTGVAIQAFGGLAKAGIDFGVAAHEKGKLEEEFGNISDELSGLNTQLNTIDQAVKSGGNKGALQMRARAALKSAVATSPLLKSQADSLYSKYFGGSGAAGAGGTSGAFSLSPKEQAAQSLGKEVATYELLGFSPEKSLQAVQVKRSATLAKAQAEILASKSEVAEYEAAPIAGAFLNEANVNFQTGLTTLLKDTGGILSAEDKLAMNRDIEMDRIRQKQAIQKMFTNPETGRLTISPKAYQEYIKDVDTQADGWSSMLQDNSAVKFYEEKVNTANSQTQLAAYELAPNMGVLRKVLGDQATGEYVKALSTGNKDLLNFITASNPEIGRVLGQQFNFVEKTSIKATSKLFDVEGASPLTPLDNQVVGHTMSASPMIAMQILDKASADKFPAITQAFPMALAATFSPRTATVRNKPTVQQNIGNMQRGALNNLNDLFRNEFGQLPSGLEITLQTRDRPYAVAGERPRRIQVNAADGSMLSQEMVNIVADIYRSIEANPDSVPESLRNKGFSPAQIATAWINSGMDPVALKYYEPFLETVTEVGRDFQSSGGRTASVGRETGNQDEGKK